MSIGRELPIKLVLLVAILAIAASLFAGCVSAGVAPRGWSGVTVKDGVLVVGSMEGKLVTINAATGATLSSVVLKTSARSSGGIGCAPPPASVTIYAAPAAGSELIYVSGYVRAGSSEFGQLYAFTSGREEPSWLFPRQGLLNRPIIGGPVVQDGRVYFASSEGKLYSLDAATGDKNWEFATQNKIWSTPALGDGTVYVASFDKGLYAIDAATGQQRWRFSAGGALVATPLIAESTVYIGSLDRNLYAIDAQGNLKWKFQGGSWFWARPVFYNDTIYAPCLDGKVYVLDAASGQERAGAISLGSRVSSSPVLVGDAVIVATEAGEVFSLNTATNEKRLIKDLERKVTSPLGAGDGVVYIHTQEREALYALNTATGAESWSPVQLSSK